MRKYTENWQIKLMKNFAVHSNESACKKSGRLGLEQVYLPNLARADFSISYFRLETPILVSGLMLFELKVNNSRYTIIYNAPSVKQFILLSMKPIFLR